VSPEFLEPPDEEASARVRQALGLRGSFILFVGDLGDRKNAITLLRAYARLPRSLQAEYEVVLVGPSGCNQRLILDFVKQSGISDRVVFTGYLEHPVLAELCKMATLFAMPSLCESFGIPVIEAMASGVPVMASNTTSIPGVAGDAALLLPPEDVDAWAGELRAMLEDQEARRQWRERGHRRAREFSWETAGQQHVEVFRMVLG
jgi:glycosyltransferase involved in cell wall biosynthesis